MVRWLVDKYLRVKFLNKKLTEEEFVAETDKSPGVLMASGLHCRRRIGGCVHRVLRRSLEGSKRSDRTLVESTQSVLCGPWADLLSLLPFLVLVIILYLVGREKLLAPKRKSVT